jgi:ParB/RepB/Spo0J family partition protein
MNADMNRLECYDTYPIQVSEIYFDPDFNCRGDFTLESVMELAESIREKGLKFPVVVQPWDKRPGYRYRLVAGHRRFRAMTVHLKAETIPAMIVTDLDDFEAAKLNLLENLERQDLNILQEALAIRRLFPEGTCREIAAALKRQPSWANIRLQLLALPEKVQEMAAAGLLVYADIEALHRLTDKPSIIVRKAERIVTSRRQHKQRQPRGIPYRFAARTRSRSVINQMIARLMDAGITGLAPRMGAWCANQITDEEFEADILKLGSKK